MNKTLVFFSSLLFFPFPALALSNSPYFIAETTTEPNYCQLEAELESGYSEQQLQTLASYITLRVMGENNGGSGTLLAKQGKTYLVLTNIHVVRGVKNINLQTFDGQTYRATIVPNTSFEKFDLTLLQFQSEKNYCLLNVAESVPNRDTQVMASGYSTQQQQILFSSGQITQIPDRPLKEGYQIGYTSNISQGMSGGPIVSSQGNLIGINGKSSYPLLNTGYDYLDGSIPSEAQREQMRKVSWGIPIFTFLAQVNRDILSAYSLPLPEGSATISTTALTGWLGDLEKKAKQITVRIDSSGGANGSGVIIAKEGEMYTVLSADHVLCERNDTTEPCQEKTYTILAPDGEKYFIDKSTITRQEGVDLAVVKFRSSKNYQVATLADYNPNSYDYVFTAGYPRFGQDSPWRFTMGRIFEKEEGLLSVTESDFQSNDLGQLQSSSSLTGGYELVYSSITYGGMSGGPVLDSLGRVIGIHGRAEGETAIDGKQIQIGFSLGIPISTFVGLASQLEVQAQKVENNRPPQLNFQQILSIKVAILSVDVSKGNATASQWIERGNQLWRLGRNEEAVKAFDEAIEQNPDFVHLAWYGKGLALSWQGKDEAAIAALKQAPSSQPDYIPALQTLSVVYRKNGKYEPALAAIDKAIGLQPDNPILYNEKWAVLSGLKRSSEALAAINRAIELSSRAAFYNKRGNTYSRQQKYPEAIADYNQAISLNPNYALAYNNRGVAYAEQQKYPEAIANYNQAISLNPNYALAYNNRGNIYYWQQKYPEAIVDYNQAISLDPNYAKSYNNRGLTYSRQQKYPEAIADYTKAISLDPNLALAYNNRGLTYAEQQKYPEAIADYTKAISLDPNLAIAYLNRSIAYDTQQKYPEVAIVDYHRAISLNPNYAETYYNRSIAYITLKKDSEALAEYNKAISVNPNLALAYNNRGIAYISLKKGLEAIADFTKAISLNPNYAEAYYNRGVAYAISQQKYPEAIADFTKAISLNPNYAIAYNDRGIAYKRLQKYTEALANYNRAIAINPNLAIAYSNRGETYDILQKYPQALADFTKAISLNPNYAIAYNNRGLTYKNLQKYPQAIADFNKAIEINTSYANAYKNRGLTYKNLQKYPQAIADIQEAAELYRIQRNITAYEETMQLLQQLQR